MRESKAMATKELGKPADPTGNYGLGQAEADKARKWAKWKAKKRKKLGLPPGSFTKDVEWRAYLDAKYPHGFKDGQAWAVEGIERPVWSVKGYKEPVTKGPPVTKGEDDSVTKGEPVTKVVTKGRPRKHGTDAEKQAAYRAKVKAARKAKRKR